MSSYISASGILQTLHDDAKEADDKEIYDKVMKAIDADVSNADADLVNLRAQIEDVFTRQNFASQFTPDSESSSVQRMQTYLAGKKALILNACRTYLLEKGEDVKPHPKPRLVRPKAGGATTSGAHKP